MYVCRYNKIWYDCAVTQRRGDRPRRTLDIALHYINVTFETERDEPHINSVRVEQDSFHVPEKQVDS